MSKLDLDYFETIMAYKSLTDGTYLASIVDYVEPEYFTNNDIKEVFKIVAEFYTKRSTPPSLSEIKSYLVTPELKTSFKNAVKLFEGINSDLNSDELYANTEQFLKEKAVYTTMMKTVEDIGNNKIDTSEILQRFEKSCSISLTHDMGIDIHKDFNTIRQDIEQDQPCISTGWKWLDGKIGGGFRRDGRAIYIFAGETNVGKSIVLGNAAVAIAKQNKTVLIISLEMPEAIYAKRLYSNISKIPISNLRGSIDALKKQIDEHAIKNPEGRILIKEFPPSTITANHLKGFIKKLTAKGIKLDAIVVDYVNLLHSTIGSNSYERVKYSTEQLRALTYEFKCPIITATQLNRSGYDANEPGLNTISESIGLAATADVICSIYRPDPENQENIISFGMMKNRFGVNSGSHAMVIDYNTLTITEDETANNTESGQSSVNLLRTLDMDS